MGFLVMRFIVEAVDDVLLFSSFSSTASLRLDSYTTTPSLVVGVPTYRQRALRAQQLLTRNSG